MGCSMSKQKCTWDTFETVFICTYGAGMLFVLWMLWFSIPSAN